MVELLDLGRCAVVEGSVKAFGVEPRHPGTRRGLEVVDPLPRTAVCQKGGRVAVQLGLNLPWLCCHCRLERVGCVYGWFEEGVFGGV